MNALLHQISRLFVALTYPPTLSACVLALAVLAWLLHWRRTAVAFAAGAIAWSALWSVPLASDWLRHTLANRTPAVAEAALPEADAIVVLGGGQYPWLQRRDVDPVVSHSDFEQNRSIHWQATRRGARKSSMRGGDMVGT